MCSKLLLQHDTSCDRIVIRGAAVDVLAEANLLGSSVTLNLGLGLCVRSPVTVGQNSVVSNLQASCYEDVVDTALSVEVSVE